MHKKQRYKKGIKVGLIGILINLILSITKVILSVSVNSVSIMADAFNNITDINSSLLTVIGFKLGNKKPTNIHPYGYARYEYISGFLIAIFMLTMSIFFIKESINKIINPESLIINKITYLILTITLIVKIFQMIYYIKMSKKLNSLTLKATSIETRNDVITNSSILISMFIMKKTNINIDGFIALIVSLILVSSSIKMLKETISLLVGIVPSQEKINIIKNKLLSYNYVKGIHNLMIHNYGVGIDYITVHLEIDSNITLNDMHRLTNQIEKDFRKNNSNITIHIDPIISNKKEKYLKKKILKIINKIDNTLILNDFRIEDKCILFNLIIPYDKEYTEEYIVKHLYFACDEYDYDINIERPYC